MADKADKKKKDEKPEKKETQQEDTKTGVLTWVIMVVIIGVLTGSGFVIGNIFADSSAPETAEPLATQDAQEEEESVSEDLDLPVSDDTWYYNDLESVVVNPDEPGATRFVRVGLILEISSSLSEEKAQKLIESKKPPLINWLNLYFKSLTLDEMEDDRDIRRILSQICDAFNEILFPDSRPLIKKTLIREFNIQ